MILTVKLVVWEQMYIILVTIYSLIQQQELLSLYSYQELQAYGCQLNQESLKELLLLLRIVLTLMIRSEFSQAGKLDNISILRCGLTHHLLDIGIAAALSRSVCSGRRVALDEVIGDL